MGAPEVEKGSLKRWAALFALLITLAGCSGGKDAVDQESGTDQRFVAGSGAITQYAQGNRVAAPDLTGKTITGAKFNLDEFKGDVVVINFWGSWCSPCRAEADDLEHVYTANKASGVQFLGVNVRDTNSRAQAYVHNFGITYPSLSDPSERVALQFRKTAPNGVPATIVLDRKGKVAAVFRTALLDTDLQPVVAKLAAETA